MPHAAQCAAGSTGIAAEAPAPGALIIARKFGPPLVQGGKGTLNGGTPPCLKSDLQRHIVRIMSRPLQKVRPFLSTSCQLVAGALILCIIAIVRNSSNGFRAGAALSSHSDNAKANSIFLDVLEPTSRWGRQHKHGLLGILAQLQSLQESHIRIDGYGRGRLDLFPPKWVEERLAGNIREPPYRAAGLMISDQYKLVFIKCTKTAGGSHTCNG